MEVSDYLAGRPHELQRPTPPVAVLTGPLTASAGEVAALAFVGRSDARLFGQPTAGKTTGNQGYFLFDGTILGLAEAAMTDRSGATHPAGVEPDDAIVTDWSTYGTADDPVLSSALAWLDYQPACAPEASPMPSPPSAWATVPTPTANRATPGRSTSSEASGAAAAATDGGAAAPLTGRAGSGLGRV